MIDRPEYCELCGRKDSRLTKHHLIPRQKGGGSSRVKAGETCPIAWLCKQCHNQVHALFTNRELKMHYSTIEKLKAHPAIIKFIEWITKRNQKHIIYHVKQNSEM